MEFETLDQDIMSLLAGLEADLGCDLDVLDFNPDEDLPEDL